VSDDIVPCLRDLARCAHDDHSVAADAADEIERLRAQVERYEKALDAVGALIAESDGVAGLHLNGDIAPWPDLLAGGRFEEWLAPLSKAQEEQ